MALANFKKQLVRNNQRLAEKLNTAKRSEKGSDFKNYTQLIDAYKQYFENAQKRVIDCLEPNPAIRTRLKASSAVSKLQGNPKTDYYPHAEHALSVFFLEYGKLIGQQANLASCLTICGEAYLKITEIKNQTNEESKGGFLKPISEALNQDIKEIGVLRKKTENRRLTYDAKRHQMEKNNTEPDETFEEAKRQYEESFNVCSYAMKNFLDGEAEQIEALSNLIRSQLTFYQDASKVLSETYELVQTNRNQTASPGMNGSHPSTTHGSNPFESDDGAEDAVNEMNMNNPMKSSSSRCRALYDFVADGPFELSFRKGDIIQLIQKVDDNWYFGSLNGNEGHFPTVYVDLNISDDEQ